MSESLETSALERGTSPSSVVLRSTSVDVTRTVARGITATLRNGDVVLLVGDLGAGKTAFTQFVGEALGVTEPVTSPTFAIMNVYECDGDVVDTLVHIDAYRLGLDAVEALETIGLYDLLDDPARRAVTFIEWGDMVASAFPEAFRIEISSFGETDRTFTCSCPGSTLRPDFVTALTILGAEPC